MRGLAVWGSILTVVVAGVLAVRVVGARLPAEHHASATGVVKASPAQLWEVLREPLRQDQWRTGVQRIQTQDPQWTPGVCWAEWRALMRFPVCVLEEQPEVRRVVKTQDWGPMPFTATWTYEMQPVEGGTRVTIQEDAVVKMPLWRFYGRYVLRDRTEVAQELRDLEREATRTR